MQREIKFRVWDKLEGRFINSSTPNQGHYIITLNGEFHNLQNGSGGNDYVIQQYTGLKDRNGVDIYEGDIVRCKSFDGWLDQIGYHYNMEVKYQTLESGDSELSGFLYINIDREVIGNIFENPELLKS